MGVWGIGLILGVCVCARWLGSWSCVEFCNADGFLLVVVLGAAFSLFVDLLRWEFLSFTVSSRFLSFPKIFSFFFVCTSLFVVCFFQRSIFPALILVFVLDFPLIHVQFVTNGGKNATRVTSIRAGRVLAFLCFHFVLS